MFAPLLVALALTAAAPAPTDPVPLLLVTDPAAVAHLEAAGHDFARRALGLTSPAPATHAPPRGTPSAALARAAGWVDLVRAITADVAATASDTPGSGVGIRFGRRLFDVRWLDDPTTRLELVGVANRLDRIPFHPDRCGELRFIYRLAYRTERGGAPLDSRLPLTLNVVFWAPERDCPAEARRWLAPPDLAGAALARWLTRPDGPLTPDRLTLADLKSVELNLQTIRWPSTVHPGLGGHAEYVQRAFGPELTATGALARLVPRPLENTPDVARLTRDRADRAALLAWLRDPATLDALDAGTAVMPDRFAATRVASFTPRGLARLANRPFRQLFSPRDLADLDLAGRAHVATPAALLRRLDTLSCAGCHQSRSVAGFHLLGDDDPARAVDALASGRSPHLHDDLTHRGRFVAALAREAPPDPTRPLAERDPARPGTRGARCGLGDPGFATWTCGAGLRCAVTDDPEVGVCVDDAPAGRVGAPCEVGPLRARPVAHRDRVPRATARPCAEGLVCERNAVGFPGGMCAGRCDNANDDATCGAIALLDPFNRCLARGEPFDRCVTTHSRPAALMACDAATPCRDDYVCARTADGGACLPPYFLFQLRVDGH